MMTICSLNKKQSTRVDCFLFFICIVNKLEFLEKNLKEAGIRNLSSEYINYKIFYTMFRGMGSFEHLLIQ